MDWMRRILGSAAHPSITACLLLVCVLSSIALPITAATEDPKDSWSGFSTTCSAVDAKNASVSCYGVRIVRKIVQQLLEKTSKEPNIEIFDGVNLVEVPGGSSPRKARLLKGYGGIGPVLQFLEGRELRIKLPNLLPQNIESAFQEGLSQARGKGGGFGGGGGGGGGGSKKGGGGGMMILALMMGKMVAAMGYAAVGVLAMKALMVSAMALMLSLIVAVKKLASHQDDGGGHHVVYAQEVGHHHRRRRNLDQQGDLAQLPYRGYAHIFGDSRVSR